MNAANIKVGRMYFAKIAGKVVPLRIIAEQPDLHGGSSLWLAKREQGEIVTIRDVSQLMELSPLENRLKRYRIV